MRGANKVVFASLSAVISTSLDGLGSAAITKNIVLFHTNTREALNARGRNTSRGEAKGIGLKCL